MLFAGAGKSPAAEMTHAQLKEENRAFLKDYCLECHNEEKQKGKVRLDQLSFTLDSVQGADLWQKILNQINSGEMPPEDSKQPERGAKTEFLDSLSHTLMSARRSLGDSGGNITMRRLNRREYKNTIRDLLGVNVDVRDLPADGGAGTFDTAGSSLFMSSDQLEQYLSLGRKALDESFARLIGLSAGVSKTEKLRKDPEEWANKYMPIYAEGYEKKYARFKAWCDAIDQSAGTPENSAVVEKLRADPRLKTQPHLFYNRFAEIQGAPAPMQFEFRDVEDAQFARSEYSFHHQYYVDYQKLPQRETGAYLMLYSLGRHTGITAPSTWAPGRYTLRVRLAATDESPQERRFIEVGTGKADASNFNVLSSHQVTGTLAKPQLLEIPIEINATGDRNFALRDKRPNNRAAEYTLFREAWDKTGSGPRPCIWVDFVELEGPASAPPLAAKTTVYKERREVELHANAMVGGTYHGYFKEGHRVAKAYLDSDRSRPPSAFGKGIPDEVEAKFRVRVFEENGPTFERYLNDPLTKTGAYLTIHNVHTEEVITLPPDQPSGWLKTRHEIETAPPGEYMLRICIGAVEGTPAERHFLMLGSRKEKDEFKLLQTFQINGTTSAPQIIEVPVSISADGPHTFVLREKRDPKLDNAVYTEARKATGVGPAPSLWIDWVEWEGPLPSPQEGGSQALLFARTQDGAGAKELLERFALRAFRDKAPNSEYLDKLVRLFETRMKAGDNFYSALKEPLSVILATPRFLYLSEPAQEKKPRPLSPSELASRLAYFLWSAPPDDTLFALARNGDLQKPAVLAAQVDRLLDSEKSREFVTGFTHQWLRMDRLDFFQFNTQLYRDFDESTKAAARSEVFRTFEHLLRENASVCDLLKSNYVIVNGLLGTFYGLEGVAGDEFRKVNLPADSPRGGLLGMAAVLAMGSNGEHTSPVERGAWVLRFLLNTPPPNAPPNVPQITRLNGQLLTTRERLLAHQEQPQCASCHRAIDPIGFGLENFNTVGKWRTEDSFQAVDANGKPNPKLIKHWTIDPSAELHKGPAFKDYFELRDIIASKPESFARGLTENLIAYALGRSFGFTDENLAEEIVHRAKAKNFALREFVQTLVGSKEFQTK
jgi:Protein of unknown function (DUF1592)/Protein of unknown function (DUF1588)/Protein of unknown function (DUF1587)/Protein of unknown function (DUF1585)/Protein of unknown function (DUF1595)/Planctomycete cytochrome C